ncbi:MAG TPA: hypothetical protein VHG08_15300 [Longimicrobium sp.]|nr:hypothetical protein [Longimicrobium sp.]
MRIPILTLTLLLAAVPAAAQAPAAASSGAAEQMRRLAFLHGTWRGEGVTMMGPGQQERASVLETAQPKLDGTVLLVEGLGWQGTEGAADYHVVHQALGVMSYDARRGGWAMRAYRGGGWVDADVTVGDGELVWAFDQPGAGRIRYTIRLDEQGRWHEVGDMSPDGQRWHRFFEMRLTREP